jgi:hypothetical protein
MANPHTKHTIFQDLRQQHLNSPQLHLHHLSLALAAFLGTANQVLPGSLLP